MSKGIVFFNDETFFKPKDKYYKEAILEAQQSIDQFLTLLKSEEGIGVIYAKFKNYRGKIVRAEAIVETVDPKKRVFNVALVKTFNKELENDYTQQKIPFLNIEDWIFSYSRDDRFEGGFLLKAKICKADEKGYRFDYNSEPFVQFIRSNTKNESSG